MSDSVKPPVWFWIVGVSALLWNLMGVMAFIMQVTMNPEALTALPEAQQQFYEAMPIWVTANFALAVFGGTLGCVLLLAGRSLAFPAFIASLVGVLIQFLHGIVIGKSIEIFGAAALAIPLTTTLIAIFLIWFSRMATTKQWLS